MVVASAFLDITDMEIGWRLEKCLANRHLESPSPRNAIDELGSTPSGGRRQVTTHAAEHLPAEMVRIWDREETRIPKKPATDKRFLFGLLHPAAIRITWPHKHKCVEHVKHCTTLQENVITLLLYTRPCTVVVDHKCVGCMIP